MRTEARGMSLAGGRESRGAMARGGYRRSALRIEFVAAQLWLKTSSIDGTDVIFEVLRRDLALRQGFEV